MKNIIYKLFSFYTKYYLKFKLPRGNSFSGIFFHVKINSQKNNFININQSRTTKSKIDINGTGNFFTCKNSSISDSLISISGKNNQLIIGQNVNLRQANIIIRGNGCKIEIGRGTTFGGIRIINVGTNNLISIGEDCLFSDHIELWASDTHTILNAQNIWINPEKPITIGDQVWVGSRVTILKGVTIGNGSIIGMGSLVTKDVPGKVISAGFPSKVIKENVNWKLEYPIREI